MTDMKLNDWRDTPLWCVFDQHWAHRFNRAGYYTLGDVHDTDVAVIARSVDNVGPVRAAKFKQKVADYANPKYDDDYEVTPSVADAAATIAALVAIGALSALAAWLLI